MKVLAITASTACASVALGDGGAVLYSEHLNSRGHAEFINQAIDDQLTKLNWKFADLDLIALDKGPGSFTGLRVAISVARSISYLIKKPCYQACSTEILLSKYEQKFQNSAAALCGINAYKNLIFFQTNLRGYNPQGPKVISPEEIEKQFDKDQEYQWIGDGLKVYGSDFSETFRKKILAPSDDLIYPSAETLLQKALKSKSEDWTLEWKFIVPLYLRDSAAEENHRMRS